MTTRFETQVVFITGASAGIGAGLALEFSNKGARVALAARSEERLQNVVAEIQTNRGTAISVVCDVTSRESLDQAVTKIIAE
jgi:NADP-dependent 3-hydroxy acid dehydrogenase YdfG